MGGIGDSTGSGGDGGGGSGRLPSVRLFGATGLLMGMVTLVGRESGPKGLYMGERSGTNGSLTACLSCGVAPVTGDGVFSAILGDGVSRDALSAVTWGDVPPSSEDVVGL